jgi:hypothetical protein
MHFSRRARIGLPVLLALLAGGAAETFAASGTSGATPTVEGPLAEAPEYRAPQGPLLADAQIDAIVHREAVTAQEPSPSDIRAVDTSLKSAVEIDPHNIVPTASDPGMAALEASTVVVVSMYGDFTLNNARVPAGRSAPTGSVLTLILDAHTGQLEGRVISDEEVPGFAELGENRVLE